MRACCTDCTVESSGTLEIDLAIRNAHGIEDTRKRLPALVEDAHRGRATLITKRGKPYAALVPVAALAHARHGPDIRALRGSGKGLWGRLSTTTLEKLRAEWD